MLELELKAVVPDPAALRSALAAAGAQMTFRGRLADQRLDRHGALAARDEVLRVRRSTRDDGARHEELAWKGPTGERDGYKARRELACSTAGAASVVEILEALGYDVVHRIDRHVEMYALGDATARIEWYPDLDTLVEVEGDPAGIERVIAATGLPRDAFSSEPLVAFAARFTQRTGRAATLALPVGASRPGHWPT